MAGLAVGRCDPTPTVFLYVGYPEREVPHRERAVAQAHNRSGTGVTEL